MRHNDKSLRSYVGLIETLENRVLLSADLTGAFTGKLPASLVLSGSNHLTLEVNNIGDAAASGKVTIALYASADATLDASDTALTPTVTKSIHLQQRHGMAVPLKFSSPSGLADGNYYILADIEPGAGISDASLANNVAATSATVAIKKAFVDFTGAVSTPLSGTITIGDKHQKAVTLGALVTNAGNVKAHGTMTVGFYASVSQNHHSTDTLLGTAVLKNVTIAPGHSVKASVHEKLGATVPSGTFYLVAQVDANAGVSETNSSNDYAASSGTFVVSNPAITAGPALASGLSADTTSVVVGHAELTEFHVTVARATSSTTVVVDQVDSSGAIINTLATLTDTGSAADGDVAADDGIYSGVNAINFAAPGTEYFAAVITDSQLVSALQTASLTVTGVNAPSQSQLGVDSTDNASITQRAMSTLSAGGSVQAAIDAVNAALAVDSNVQAGTIQSADGVITWVTSDGITEGVDANELAGTDILGGASPAAAASAAVASTPVTEDAASPDPTMNVLILSPFASSLSQWDPSSAIESQFANAGYTVTYHTNQNVTLGDFSNLGQYDAIEIYGHGDKLPGASGGEVIYTSIASSATTSLANAWSLLNDRVIILNNYYCITPSYITANSGQMNGTIVEVNACNSAYDSTMADAFTGNGAAAYLGYTHVVKAGFAAGKATDTWTTLLQTDNNTVGDIPGLGTAHDTNNPAAYFVAFGDTTATLPQGQLLKDNELYIRYDWPQSQTDLDSNTTFLGNSVGYNLAGGPYLNWTGDDTTSGGVEITTVDLYSAWTAAGWSKSTSVTAGADWYTPAGGSGPAFVTIALENISTGKLTHVVNEVVNPGQETDGAGTVVASISVTLGGDSTNPTVAINVT